MITSLEVAKLAVACVVPAMMVPLRQWVVDNRSLDKGASGPLGLFDVLLAPPMLAAVAGVALGWGAPAWIRGELQATPTQCFLFLAGWVGLSCGSSLDLRVTRRLTRARVANDLLLAIAAIASVAILVWIGRLLPTGWVAIDRFHVLTLASVCLLGRILPDRQRHRGSGSGAAAGGFWTPALQSPLALLLAAGAVASISSPIVYFELPAPLSQVVVAELGGVGAQLFWATVGGAVAGLLMDLVTREDFAPGGLYVQMGAVALVLTGLAAMMGLSPLWIGLVAGFWSLSATLRRIDLLLVLDRGMALPRIAAPALAGWCVGVMATTTGPHWPLVLATVSLIVLVRPALHVTAAVVERRRQKRRGGRRPQAVNPSIIESDEGALVVVGTAGLVTTAVTQASLLMGILLAQLVLSAGTQIWRDRLNPAAPEGAAGTAD